MENKYIHNNFNELNTDDKIDLITSGYSVSGGLSKKDAFELLQKKIAESETKQPKIVYRKAITYWSIAASVLVLVGLFFVYKGNSEQTIVALAGQHIEHKLPDGSIVTLNAGSQISYSESNFRKKRSLHLLGEAFFNVEKGSQFVVETQQGSVEVLGTSFNVYVRKTNFVVSCKTGKVKVSSEGNSEIITQGEYVVKENNLLKKNTLAETNTPLDWIGGTFHFENSELQTIFEEIERQYNVSIECGSVANEKFTGSFTNKNLTETLDIVCIPMGLKYEIKSQQKIIISKAAD